MNTYINDRKLAEYPFYDVGQTPFPPGCIKYLGVCLEGTAGRSLYASAVTISLDGVLVSICRETEDDAGEPIGSVYATASSGSASAELPGGIGSISLLIDKSMLANAYGNYTGKFYLDPSCVTYVESSVAGSIKSLAINGSTFTAYQSLNFSSVGDLLTLSRTNSSTNDQIDALLTGGSGIDTYRLVSGSLSAGKFVDTVNNLSPLTVDEAEPELAIVAGAGDDISLRTYLGATDDSALVVEILGGTGFPNCYNPARDEAR